MRTSARSTASFPTKTPWPKRSFANTLRPCRRSTTRYTRAPPTPRPKNLPNILIDLFMKLRPQARALTALLDSCTKGTEDRQRLRTQLRAQTLAGIKTALTICAPDLDDKEAEDIAAVVLNNMKTMWGMAKKDVPTTPGAPDQLRLMNRLYLAAVLRPGRLTAQYRTS